VKDGKSFRINDMGAANFVGPISKNRTAWLKRAIAVEKWAKKRLFLWEGWSMAGRKGRSGRKPLSVEEHILRGTFRADRHGSTTTTAAGPPADPSTLARLGAGLADAGHALCAGMLHEFADWDSQSLAFLRAAAEAADRVAEYRALIARDGVVLKGVRGKLVPHPLLRHERAASAAMVAGLRSIECRRGTPEAALGRTGTR
jgi:hypothetical protein